MRESLNLLKMTLLEVLEDVKNVGTIDHKGNYTGYTKQRFIKDCVKKAKELEND